MDNYTRSILIITWIITSHLQSFYRYNQLFVTNYKVEVDEPHGNWRITVAQSECKIELTYHAVEGILNDNKSMSTHNVRNLVMCRLRFFYWKDLMEATLSFTQTSPYLGFQEK